jgi:hypothetical protein
MPTAPGFLLPSQLHEPGLSPSHGVGGTFHHGVASLYCFWYELQTVTDGFHPPLLQAQLDLSQR